MKRGWASVRGFTIVELLIVIVVIAILAAITIAAYNGIQSRAKNSATIAAATQTIKLLNGYYTANGALPATANTCITEACTRFDGVAEGGSRATLLANLSTIGSLPSSTPTAGSSAYNGIWYNVRAVGATYDGSNPNARVVLLMYWLTGQSQNCTASNMATQGTGEAWLRTASTFTYNYPATNTTACWVAFVAE